MKLRERYASEYSTWLMMRVRCRSAGIPMDARWGRFERFLEDLGPRPRGCALVRTRAAAPFGPGGYAWQPKVERQRRRPGNRLAAADVVRIRLKVRHGASRSDLARLYGVSLAHIGYIVAGDRWKGVGHEG